jgi:hypothetical protein
MLGHCLQLVVENLKIANVAVPLVQRIERTFPKGKTKSLPSNALTDRYTRHQSAGTCPFLGIPGDTKE